MHNCDLFDNVCSIGILVSISYWVSHDKLLPNHYSGIPQLLPHPFFKFICHRSSMPCTYIATIILHSQNFFMHTYIQPDVTTNFLPKSWLENSPGQVKPYVYPSGFLLILLYPCGLGYLATCLYFKLQLLASGWVTGLNCELWPYDVALTWFITGNQQLS